MWCSRTNDYKILFKMTGTYVFPGKVGPWGQVEHIDALSLPKGSVENRL